MPKASRQTASETWRSRATRGTSSTSTATTRSVRDLHGRHGPEPVLPGSARTIAASAQHWGYVIKGKVTFTFTDGHEETYETGDAYYAPAGHTPGLFAGTEVVEFSPMTSSRDAGGGQKNMEAVGA